MTNTVTVQDVFGRSADATVYVGEYDGVDGAACPFCGSVFLRRAQWPRCENGWCSATKRPDDPDAPRVRAAFINQAHNAALQEKEERWRKGIHESAMKRIDEEKEAKHRDAENKRVICQETGYCLRCATAYPSRWIRHRPGHPHRA